MDLATFLTQLTRADRALDTIAEYDIDPIKREIFFHADVEEGSASELIKAIKYVDTHLCEKDDDMITLHICSYGGSVDHMFAIYDTIQSTKHKVITVGTGAICSAAFLILACGTKRMVTQNATAMIHKISGGAIGTEEEAEAQVQVMKKHQQLYYDILAQHTKLTAAQWREMVNTKGEGWLDAAEMLETGLIDEIVPSRVKPPRKRVRRKKAPTKKK